MEEYFLIFQVFEYLGSSFWGFFCCFNFFIGLRSGWQPVNFLLLASRFAAKHIIDLCLHFVYINEDRMFIKSKTF